MDWVPVPNRMDGEGYTQLVDHPNGAAHLGAWLAIVEIASRRDVRGTLPQEGAGTSQALARISRLPAGLFAEVIPRLVQIGWIEELTPIPQEGAGIPQDGAGECLRARVTEGKGMEVNGREHQQPELPKLNGTSEFPKILAEIQRHDAAADAHFARRLMGETIQACLSSTTFPPGMLEHVTDENVARCVAESYRTGPQRHGAGLLLKRVPNIVIAWSQEEAS